MQKPKQVRCLLMWCLMVAILSLAISPASAACQLHHECSRASTLSDQIASTQKRLDGIWVGVVVVSGIKVSLILRVAQNPAGPLSARLDVPAQGASDLPVESITVEGQIVRFQASNLGTYEGTLSNDASEIVGELKQGPTTLLITFKRSEERRVGKE